jgi:hypothetical protein
MTTLCPARLRRILATPALLLALGGAVACAVNPAQDLLGLPAQTSAQELPLDVQEFVIQQNKCDDWRRAVVAGDPRREKLGKDIVAICGKKHAELARLKTKYAENPRVLYSLQFYEEE